MKRHLSAHSVESSNVGVKSTHENIPTIFGTGLIALDIILSAYPNRSPILAAGGTCGNVLTGLSFLGWDAFPIARLSADVASETVSSDLNQWGVDLEFARQTPSAPTPIILQRNDRGRDGKPRHRYSVACPACGAWYPSFRAVTTDGAESVIEAVEDASHSGFAPQVFFFDRVSRGALLLANSFAERGALVVFEPIGIGDPKLFSEALSLAHIVKYSDERIDAAAVSPPVKNRMLLEVQTLGQEGLRYRFAKNSRAVWEHLESVSAAVVMDTAGAGDWLTAAFLSLVANSGIEGFLELTRTDLRDALRFGQGAASSACEHEGARGVMSALNRVEFHARIASLLSGNTIPASDAVTAEIQAPSSGSHARVSSRHADPRPDLEALCPTCPC